MNFFLIDKNANVFFKLLSLSLSLGNNVAFFSFLLFGNNVASNIAPLFCFFFSFSRQSRCQLPLFFSWALTLPLFLFSFFPIFFFSFDFLGLGHDSFFLFYTRCDFFFWDMIFIFIINLGDCSFLCGYLTLSCFNWELFFNKGV